MRRRVLLLLLAVAGCQRPMPAPPVLRVLTLNVAHGRAEAVHQALLGRERIEKNLEAVAALLRRSDAHVVALQEVDGPSSWSGDFDHVAFLAERAGYPHRFRGEHVHVASGDQRLSYGCALLSRLPLEETRSETFAPTPPTPIKGFVRAIVRFGGRRVEVVSVHLDFLRAATRRAQAAQLAASLGAADDARVVCGDFNCEWTPEPLLASLGLDAYAPRVAGHGTFPSEAPRRRLDWVLIRGFEFRSHATLPDRVSDHRAVLVELSAARARSKAAR